MTDEYNDIAHLKIICIQTAIQDYDQKFNHLGPVSRSLLKIKVTLNSWISLNLSLL